MTANLKRCLACSAAATALGLILLGLYSALVTPWLDQLREQRNAITTLSGEIDHLTRISAQGRSLEENRRELDDRVWKAGYFLKADSPASAAVGLIDSVKGMAKRYQAQLIGAEVLPPVMQQDIVRIAVRYHLRGGEHALLNVLYQHENQCPMLFVDNVEIRSLNSVARLDRPRTPQSIDIRFDLLAYMLRD
jgi:hypothetical protein